MNEQTEVPDSAGTPSQTDAALAEFQQLLAVMNEQVEALSEIEPGDPALEDQLKELNKLADRAAAVLDAAAR